MTTNLKLANDKNWIYEYKNCNGGWNVDCWESQVGLCYHSANQFDVSFPEKPLTIVDTRGEIFSLKFTKYRLAAGLRPDPLGELKRSPRPPIRKKGPTSKGREEGEEKGGKRDKKTGTPRATCHVVVAYRPIAYRRPTFDDDDKTTTR